MKCSVLITLDFPAALVFLRRGSRFLPTWEQPWKLFRPEGELDQNVRTWLKKLKSESDLKILIFNEIATALRKFNLELVARSPHGFSLAWRIGQRTVPLPPESFYRRLIDVELKDSSREPWVIPREVVAATWAEPTFLEGYDRNGGRVLQALGAHTELPRDTELSYFDFALYLAASRVSAGSLPSLARLSSDQLALLRDLEEYFAGVLAVLEQPVTAAVASPLQSMDELSGVWQIETMEVFVNPLVGQRFCDALFDVSRDLSPGEVQRSAEHPANLLMPTAVFDFNEARDHRPELVRYWRGKIILRMNGEELVSTTEDFQNGHFFIKNGRVTAEGLVVGHYRFVEVDSSGTFYLWRVSEKRMEGSYIGHEPTDMNVKRRRFPIVCGQMYCTKLDELPTFGPPE